MRANTWTGLLSAGLLSLVAVHPSAQAPTERKLQLSFDHGGLVTLVAQNVTVRDILAEWARQGGTQMVNADKLTGAPITVQFEAQPEAVVLDSLLRSVAGYILVPRLAGSTGASTWQSVSILPTSHPTALYSAPTSAPQIAPVVQPMPDDEIPPVNATPPAQTQQAPPQNRPYNPGVYVPLTPVTNSPGTPAPGMGSGTGTGTGPGTAPATGTGTTTGPGRGRGGGV